MLRRVALLRCASNGVEDDRTALARNHLYLLERRHWDLTTPSRALPVLEVLLRSGTVLEGLEGTAARPLWGMSPTMTKKERSLMQRVSAMLRVDPAATSPTSSRRLGGDSEAVQAAYMAACATGKCTVSATVDAALVGRLALPVQLMLLELLLSRFIDVTWAQQPPVVTKEVLDRVCDELATHEAWLTFRVVWWLLTLLAGDRRLYRDTIDPAAGRRLFGLCVRRIHQLLPDLHTDQRLLVHLLLTTVAGYDRPFIVIGEIERLALAASPAEFDTVGTKLLLHFMSTTFAAQQTAMTMRLCLRWARGTRVADFDCDDCLLAVTIIATLHARSSADAALAVAALCEWESLHDCIFAQVFLIANDLTPAGCLSVLDQAELINVSGWGITVPQVLVEKVKRRILAECRRSIESDDLSLEMTEGLLRIVLGLQHLMRRCTVLPCSDSDERLLSQYVRLLEQRFVS